MTGSNAGWRDYWKADRQASCVATNAATDRDIGLHWSAILGELADCSRVLDVATGNGVVLGYAAAAAAREGKRFLLTGVDLADIDPPRHVANLPPALLEAEFLGGVSAERLPFADRSFDAVVSQYGLEYADLDAALSEVERVVVPGGWLHWLAHSEASEVVLQNRDQGVEVDFLLAPGGPIDIMKSFANRMRKRRNMQHSLSLLQSGLLQAEEFCRAHPPAKVVRQVCSEFAEVARRWQAYDPNDVVKMMNEGEHRLVAHRQRIHDLQAAILTPAREALVRDRLQRAGWQSLAVEPLHVGSAASPIGLMIGVRRRT